jgi:hypothetical protein
LNTILSFASHAKKAMIQTAFSGESSIAINIAIQPAWKDEPSLAP